jgi:hypothetical protein
MIGKIACWIGWHQWALVCRALGFSGGADREVLWFVCPRCAKRREISRRIVRET